ncbi:MAG: hypothetical protein A2Y33_15735 [Spirochaetes bacterium GWF1_51_8]|nr:MAG: hypothetical protein A2Y33_15735 [Spirochaetes bacterium GWF1_51_8]
MASRAEIVEFFKNLCHPTDGFEGWLSDTGHPEVFERLASIDEKPLSKVQLDQLLLLSLASAVSDGFFSYYWLSIPPHTYDIKRLNDFDHSFAAQNAIISLAHLRWGLERVAIDALLYFGSIERAFAVLARMSEPEIFAFFNERRYPTAAIKTRGKGLRLNKVLKEDRYLISEMACKTYGDMPESQSELKEFLIENYRASVRDGNKNIRVKDLFDRSSSGSKHQNNMQMLLFSADDLLEDTISSESDLEKRYGRIAEKFIEARKSALKNTEYFLSMINDLDVYMSTSMRTRSDFRTVADACEKVFGDQRLQDLNLRYFDPTLSAAEGHEDKGLIECLMVRSAKVLVYIAGERESFGKDAEAAMALTLGKPVIFYCDSQQRKGFYKDVHPLSRLIDFQTGVAVGAIVTDRLEEVAELLDRIFENAMEYVIEQPEGKPGYYRLKEKLTNSVIRIQTNNKLLSRCFWNFFSNAKYRDSKRGRDVQE